MSQEVSGDAREMHICQSCASNHRDIVSSTFPLADLFFGVTGAKPMPDVSMRMRRCPECGMTRQEFAKRQRLGCAACYAAHSADVSPMLREMQRSDRHIGKVPASRVAVVALAELEGSLAKAVACENYEEAAMIRDRIYALRGGKHAG